MYRSCILAALLLLVGCGRAQSPTTEVVVSAAISISEAMQQVAFDFEEATGLRVALNIGGSDTLATQLIAGASVDLFVSADLRQMTRVEVDGGILTASKVNLLSNQLVLVIHGDNLREFSGIGDLAESNIRRVAMGDPDAVPAGVYARQFLQVSGRVSRASLTTLGLLIGSVGSAFLTINIQSPSLRLLIRGLLSMLL